MVIQVIAEHWKLSAFIAAVVGYVVLVRSMNLTTKEIERGIEIDASDAEVWDILSDFKAYPEWNPYITYIEGEISMGKRLYVEMRQGPEERPGVLRPEVKCAVEARELRWLGHSVVPGLFDTELAFVIAPLRERRIRFTVRGYYSGLLVPPFRRVIGKGELRAFERMNEALKIRAEERGRP